MKKIFLMSVCAFFALSCFCYAENQISLKVGYHWWESGQTFAHADENDREVFDKFRVELEYSHWWDNWGIALNGGVNEKIDQDLTYSPRWVRRSAGWTQTKARMLHYEAMLYTAEIIPQYRFRLKRADLRIGFGLNYSYLDNDYSWTTGDTLDGFGWVGLLGADYFLSKEKKWAFVMDAKYVRNDLKSDKWKRTYFRVGGLIASIGLKYCW